MKIFNFLYLLCIICKLCVIINFIHAIALPYGFINHISSTGQYPSMNMLLFKGFRNLLLKTEATAQPCPLLAPHLSRVGLVHPYVFTLARLARARSRAAMGRNFTFMRFGWGKPAPRLESFAFKMHAHCGVAACNIKSSNCEHVRKYKK